MIEILKAACEHAYVETFKLIGTREGSVKISAGAGGDVSRKIDLVAERAVIETVRNAGEDHPSAVRPLRTPRPRTPPNTRPALIVLGKIAIPVALPRIAVGIALS